MTTSNDGCCDPWPDPGPAEGAFVVAVVLTVVDTGVSLFDTLLCADPHTPLARVVVPKKCAAADSEAKGTRFTSASASPRERRRSSSWSVMKTHYRSRPSPSRRVPGCIRGREKGTVVTRGELHVIRFQPQQALGIWHLAFVFFFPPMFRVKRKKKKQKTTTQEKRSRQYETDREALSHVHGEASGTLPKSREPRGYI